MSLSQYNVSGLLGDVMDVFEVKLKDKDLSIKIFNPNDPEVLVDKNIFTTQNLNNLISNSIKFSNNNDAIEIKVNEINDIVIIGIKDNGIGIPENVINNIFDFSAVTTSTGTQGEKGTGFGMPIVSSFLQKFNGKISIKSSTEDNSYTEIVLDLPQAV